MTTDEMNEKVAQLQNDVLEKATESARLMSDMVQAYDRQNRRLWVAVLALAASVIIMAGCMVWAVQNAQKLANEAVWNALNQVAEIGVTQETTTTTTQSVEGDAATINNVEGEQYNDSAVDEGGGS